MSRISNTSSDSSSVGSGAMGHSSRNHEIASAFAETARPLRSITSNPGDEGWPSHGFASRACERNAAATAPLIDFTTVTSSASNAGCAGSRYRSTNPHVLSPLWNTPRNSSS
jgi:hypothetical protein